MRLLNAFTPGMLAAFPATVRFWEIPEAEAREIAARGIESAVGHESTAQVFSARLGVHVAPNRATIKLAQGEKALLGQYTGPRLPEGRVLTAEELSAAGVRWILVEVAAAE